jgi:hypothetical protein
VIPSMADRDRPVRPGLLGWFDPEEVPTPRPGWQWLTCPEELAPALSPPQAAAKASS